MDVSCGNCLRCMRAATDRPTCSNCTSKTACAQHRCLNASPDEKPKLVTAAMRKRPASSTQAPLPLSAAEETLLRILREEAGVSDPALIADLTQWGSRRDSRRAASQFDYQNNQPSTSQTSAQVQASSEPRQKRKYTKRVKVEKEPERPREPTQCFSYDCPNEARPNSRYCSDECGKKTAALLFTHILPDKIALWRATKSIVDEQQKARLCEIDNDMKKCTRKLRELESEAAALQSWLEVCAKQLSVEDSKQEQEGDDSGDSDGDEDAQEGASVQRVCRLCGNKQNETTLARHVLTCYMREEQKMNYDGPFIKNPCNLICMAETGKPGLYCRRLRVLCADHFKLERPNSNVACAAPINVPVVSGFMPRDLNPHNPECLMTKACRKSRRRCSAHYMWHIIMQGAIDQARMQMIIKIEELQIEREQLTNARASRPNTIGLLFNETRPVVSTKK